MINNRYYINYFKKNQSNQYNNDNNHKILET